MTAPIVTVGPDGYGTVSTTEEGGWQMPFDLPEGRYLMIREEKVRIDSVIEGWQAYYEEVFVYPGERMLIVRGNTDD